MECYSLRNFVYFCGRIRSKDLIDMGKRRDDKELAAIASKYDVLKSLLQKSHLPIGQFMHTDYSMNCGLTDKLCGHMKRRKREN